ncbi:hypothetical protein KI387_012030 [Taxus chinensis]|uniref:Uncharacterized protein n=1 Tax=Taxus chinensis TaxID=29808 RepID=A0AA38FG53_TAXCH|nr:hypothetical protein KI387_012030 [Taxus chinensis]
MSCIPVPDLYRQSILQEELEVGKSNLEQREFQCRQQLSMSHLLGSSVNGDANHSHLGWVDIESGRWASSQGQQGTQVRTSSCKAFSIRGYVENVREVDLSKCWPFHPHLLQRRMGENMVTLLPPLEVPTYRYWECLECLDNKFILDNSDKRRNGLWQPDSLTNDALVNNGDANLPTKRSENEYAGSGNGIQDPRPRGKEANGLEEEEAAIEAGERVEVDKRSGSACVENHKDTLHNDQQQPEYLINAAQVNCDATLPIKISKNEHACSGNGIEYLHLRGTEASGLEEKEAAIEAAQCLEVDKRSRHASVEIHKETLHNDQQQPDNLTNGTPENGDANLPTKLSKNAHACSGNGIQNPHLRQKGAYGLEEEEAATEVAECMEVDKRSWDASVENHKKTLHSEDRAALHGTIKHLTSHKTSDDDNSCSEYEIVACNATVWPTDSEETSSAKQSFSSEDDDQIVSNCTSQMKTETNTFSFTEKADHVNHMHCTVNKAALYEIDEDIFEENTKTITAEEETEKFMGEIPKDNTSALSIIDDAEEEGCIAKLKIDEIPPTGNKHGAKRQNGKGKTMKERSISDLIAVAPNEKLQCNEENWKFKLKHMSRRAKIEMWRVSTAAAKYSSQKFKAPDKPNSESEVDKRKLQCQGISCQSSTPEKSVKEARRVLKRHFGSKKLRSPQKGMVAKASRKRVHMEELVQNELEKQAVSDPDGDLMNDLAHFMVAKASRKQVHMEELVQNELEKQAVSDPDGDLMNDLAHFMVAKASRKQVHMEELVQNELEKQAVSDPDGDLLNDLAHFMAKHQYERHATTSRSHNLKGSLIRNKEDEDGNCLVAEKLDKSSDPIQPHNSHSLKDELVKGTHTSSYCSAKPTTVDSDVHHVKDGEKINQVQESGKHEIREMPGNIKEVEVILDSVIGNLQETEFLKGPLIQEDEDGNCFVIEKLDQSGNPIRLYNNHFLKDKLVKRTDTFSYCSAKHATVDGEVVLLVEDGKRINQVQESGKNEKWEMLGQAKEVEVISDTVIDTSSTPDHHACKSTETVDGNQKRDATAQSLSDKNSIGNDGVINTQRNSGSCASKKKSIEHLGKLFNLNRDQLPILEQSNASLDAAVHDFSATRFNSYDNGVDESVPYNSCIDALQSHNNGSHHSVPKSPCKDISQTVVVTTFGPAQTNAAAAADPIQTVIQPDLSPLHCQSRLTNPNMIREFEKSESSNLKATQVYQTETCPKVNRDYTAVSAGNNRLLGVMQPSMGEKNFYTNLLLSSTDGDFMFESSEGIVEQVKDQISQKQGAQPITTFPVLSGTGQQPLKILNGMPVKNFSLEHGPSNNIEFQPSFDCNLPYKAPNTPSSLAAELTANAAEQQPLRLPIILSFAQGNKLDTQTTLSQECFDQGKLELQSYIEKRLQNYGSSKARKIIVTSQAEKCSEDEDIQTADSQDKNLCIINKNLVEYMNSKSSLTKKRKICDRQRIAVLALGTSGHCTKNKEVKLVQPDSSIAPQSVPSLSQTNMLGRSMKPIMKISDGQNCRKEMVADMSHGGNMNMTLENADEQIPKRRKVNKGQQSQIESQISEPTVVALSQTNLLKQKFDSQSKTTLRSGKLLDPTCLKTNMHADGPKKYVKIAEKEAAETRRKLEVHSHSIQTQAHAMDYHTRRDKNSSSQDLSSAANEFSGFKHVLKPIAPNTHRRLPVPPIPFPADQQDKAAEEAQLAILKLKMSMIHNKFDHQAIANYIKWGTFSVDPPSLGDLPTKVGGGVSFQSKLNQNGKFVNPTKSGEIHLNLNGTENNMLGAISNTSGLSLPSYAINTNSGTPPCAGNPIIGIPSHTSNRNGFTPSSLDNDEIVIPPYAGNGNGNIANAAFSGNIPGLLKPLAMSEQEVLLYQIQAYLDKSNLHFSSFTHADKPLSTSMDSPLEPNLST